MLMYVVLHGNAQTPVGKAQNTQNELKQKCLLKQGKAIYVNTAAQMTLVEAQTGRHMSSNIYVAMKNTNAGTRMLMYVVLHGTIQIPAGKAQKQAQNELNQKKLLKQ